MKMKKKISKSFVKQKESPEKLRSLLAGDPLSGQITKINSA
jgi:hypothetical protein